MAEGATHGVRLASLSGLMEALRKGNAHGFAWHPAWKSVVEMETLL